MPASGARRRHLVLLLALAAPAPVTGCTTTSVNFVVTDEGGHDVPADGAAGSAGDDGAIQDGDDAAPVDGTAVDAASLDAAAKADAAASVTDIDAQIVDGSPPFTGPSLDGPSHFVEYKCCVTDGGTCFVATQGDMFTCRDSATWTVYATTDCANQGLVVNGVGLYLGC